PCTRAPGDSSSRACCASSKAEPLEVLARAAHGLGDLRQRRPRLAAELDLDGVRPLVARLAQHAQHAGEVDVAGADLAEVPDALPALGLLQVDVDELVRNLGDVVDGVGAGVED